MKVTFVISSLRSGGAERVCSTLSNYFVGKGFDVDILIKSDSGSIHYDLSPRIRVKEISYSRNKRKGVFFLLKASLFYSIALHRIIRSDKPDIIISFGTDINGIVILNAKLLRMPVIVSDRNTYKLTNMYWKIVRQYIYRFADSIVLLTNYDKINYYDKYIRNSVIIPNPVLPCIGESGIGSKALKVILCVGNLDKWHAKGFDRMLLIYKNICSKHADWKLWIVGGGNPDILKAQAESLGILQHIEFLGRRKDMQHIYQQSAIFSLPSRIEGMPNVLLEAMACGCACVSFDITTGPSEIIDDGKDGYLIRDNDLEMFEKAILNLIEDEELRKRTGENAIRKSDNFHIDKIGEKWIDLIYGIVKEQK